MTRSDGSFTSTDSAVCVCVCVCIGIHLPLGLLAVSHQALALGPQHTDPCYMILSALLE